MGTVGAYEAKTHLPKLLDRVSKGERITITKHGVPVAVLQPPAQIKQAMATEVIAQIRKFRKKHKLAGHSLKEMIEEGRR
jgi:prevent-host-death family protein